jgi:methionyl-tRNA formyltransferase
VRVVFAGTPEFALPALRALIATHELVGVLTQPDRPSGRGRHLSASPVKTLAAAHSLPLAQPATLKDQAAQMQLAAWRPDVLVVVAYGLLLPAEVLRLPRYGCLNIHASLLPRWRGAAPVQRALLAGDAVTGVTIMQMDAGLDTGPILLARELAIGAANTGGSLHDALAPLGATALLEALEGLADGTLRPRPQPTLGVTYAAKIAKSEARIDWTQDAAHIERQVRAFNPWPIAETELQGERLRIYAAAVSETDTVRNVPVKGTKTPRSGVIIAIQDGNLLVQCGGESLLAVREVQRPGGKVLAVSELAHNRDLPGSQLG